MMVWGGIGGVTMGRARKFRGGVGMSELENGFRTIERGAGLAMGSGGNRGRNHGAGCRSGIGRAIRVDEGGTNLISGIRRVKEVVYGPHVPMLHPLRQSRCPLP